jgi:hypothetical protein
MGSTAAQTTIAHNPRRRGDVIWLLDQEQLTTHQKNKRL